MVVAPAGDTAAPLSRAPLSALFLEFLKVSFLGFGGGIVLAHRAAVERHRWMTEGDFADALTLCQFMPGPNVVGIAVCIGAKTRGLPGALAGFLGFALVPGAVGFALALLYLDQTRIPALEHVLHGISAAAAGLMVATGLRLLRPHRRHAPTLTFAALAFGGLAIARFPLLLVLMVLAPLSVLTTLASRRGAS
jgi:chromate transporter